MTDYVILGRDTTGCWRELKLVGSTVSAEQAIRSVAQTDDGYEVFVAVPSRSWKPLKVERTQVTQTKLAPVTPPKEKPE